MVKPLSIFVSVAKRPMEAIEAIIALILFLTGVWFLTPWYTPNPGASSQLEIVDGITLSTIFGTVQIFMAGPLLYALLRQSWSQRNKIRRLVTFTCFVLLTFYGFSGVILFGTQRLSWLQTFGLALISAVCHLRLKWEMETQDAGH
jgi:Ni,Fe-hydrogenase I cytochrome b subunit